MTIQSDEELEKAVREETFEEVEEIITKIQDSYFTKLETYDVLAEKLKHKIKEIKSVKNIWCPRCEGKFDKYHECFKQDEN